jgi:hypothetical protein
MLVDREYDPGSYSLPWDGRDGRGRDVASGVYFYRTSIGAQEFQHRMVLLR